MKRLLLALVSFVVVILPIQAQSAKKPSLMIMPDEKVCESYPQFIQVYDNQGIEVRSFDYVRILEKEEVSSVITLVGSYLAEAGFVVKDAVQASKALNARTAENDAVSSKSGDYSLMKTSLDELKERLKSDILIQIGWGDMNDTKGSPIIQYTVEAFDCYSGFRIPATIIGSCRIKKLDSGVISLLNKDLPGQLPDFENKLQKYFEDSEVNGREIALDVRRWEDWEEDLDSEFDGTPLSDIIDAWMADNTVRSEYNLIDSDENMLTYEQVRIAFANAKGTPQNARSFASSLRAFLKSEYDIPAKVISSGLGRAVVILGDNN